MQRINVTKSFLPPKEEYYEQLNKIWESGQLTNQGQLLREFESKVSEYLDVENFHFLTNGTIALQIALRALDITEGEIITTPFSYVATTSAILWERCKPVFVDIEPDTLVIDAKKIEAAITDKTRAILAVHVFGNPCDIETIEQIATKYNLKVVYDAAHAFGVKYKGKSIFEYGDISMGSFHATKVFHTIEGGCLVANDKYVSDNIELIKKFGHHGDDHRMLGINAKASEFQAAMGLCNLKYVDINIAKRKNVTKIYDEELGGLLTRPIVNELTTQNFSYYPVLFKNEKNLLKTVDALNEDNVYPRRYFYPSLNKLQYIDATQKCPNSEDISKRILCLPLYQDLDEADVYRIVEIIKSCVPQS